MASKVLITGGNGLVAAALSHRLIQDGFQVSHLSRAVTGKEDFPTYKWNIGAGQVDPDALNVDHIIHLAGAGVADQRWTTRRKEIIRASRVDSAALLLRVLQKEGIMLQSFVSASGIGYYGVDTGDKLCTEASESSDESFLSGLVSDWENSADQFEPVARCVTKLRIGLVLDGIGGALQKMAAPVRMGVGAALGSGKQWVSWIHIEDLCNLFHWILTTSTPGVYNAVAPNPISNQHLTQAIGKTLKRPIWLPNVPGLFLRLAFGEMAGIILGGNNVSSKKLVDSGFKFRFQEIESALKDLL